MNKFITFLFLIVSTLTISAREKAPSLSVRDGAPYSVRFDKRSHAFTILKGKQTLLASSVPEARFGTELVTATDLPTVTRRTMGVKHPSFGRGKIQTYAFTDGQRVMTLIFSIFTDAVVAQLTISSADGSTVESNYLAPIKESLAHADKIGSRAHVAENRFLKVPFDNDDFVRYHLLPLDTMAISYEVGALLDPASRAGLVLGSIDHDHWKSAVTIDHGLLAAFSGVATKETRDVLPHGCLVGQQVSSARFLITARTDWRDAMEQFARTCNSVQPGRKSWQHGTPFGWQSWGVLATKNSFETDCDVSDYMAQTLRPAGFCSDDGTQVLSIDAWDNLNSQQKRDLCAHAKRNGQVPGTYVTPFCLWWNDGDLDRPLFEGCSYTGRDACAKVNGQPFKYDGAFCLDPTHPATLERFAREAAALKAAGFQYFKIDFTSNGMVQADNYYDANVRTAVEAYNYGFSRFIQELDRGEKVFTALSIAPIFPYHYGNSRRIACDTWGKIDQSEYAMNAISYGWWTNEFYQFNDPDHLVLVGKEAAHGDVESEGENRARYTTGICSAMVLLPDVWSERDRSGHGDARLSFERAKHIVMNPDINAIARGGQSFRPLYGGRQWRDQTGAAENLLTLRTDSAVYLAAINYSEEPLNVTVPISDICSSSLSQAKELWTGETVTLRPQFSLPQPQFLISVPAKDARLYRFTLK
ncbi:MAG: hypothetical protein ILA06_08605 [Bacteroidaceae bacterium]|nr:hypothetical protein [Bacteroidaceae bacterium]